MSDDIRLKLPLSKADVRQLKAGDFVLLDGDIVLTAGLPTHERIREHMLANKPLPIDITGGSLLHLGSYSRETNGKFDVLYMNPTTSTRFNGYMPEFIRHTISGWWEERAASITPVPMPCARSGVSISRSWAAVRRCTPTQSKP